jgi:hypothetical protein
MDALFDEPLEVTHPDMAGNEVGKGGGDADEGAVHLFTGDSGPHQQSALWGALKTFSDRVAAFGCHRFLQFL